MTPSRRASTYFRLAVFAAVLTASFASAQDSDQGSPAEAAAPSAAAKKEVADINRSLNQLAAEIGELSRWQKNFALYPSGMAPLPGCSKTDTADGALHALFRVRFTGGGELAGVEYASLGGDILEYHLCKALSAKNEQSCDQVSEFGTGIGESADDCHRLYSAVSFTRDLLKRGNRSDADVCRGGAIHGLLSPAACAVVARGAASHAGSRAICSRLTAEQKQQAGMGRDCSYQVSLLLGRIPAAQCAKALNPIDVRMCGYTSAFNNAVRGLDTATCADSSICKALDGQSNPCVPIEARLKPRVCRNLREKSMTDAIDSLLRNLAPAIKFTTDAGRLTAQRARFRRLTAQYKALQDNFRRQMGQ